MYMNMVPSTVEVPYTTVVLNLDMAKKVGRYIMPNK